MTLLDLLENPKSTEELRHLALVFSAELRDRLVSVQSDHGHPRFTAFPAGPLTTGDYYHCASILTEVSAGRMYSAGFARLDASRFDEIAVMPLADALALLPAEPIAP
ncbi:MAG: hypothetical protein O3A60_02745 [Planctomycetota bacterium]|nr:hypothetical protein [Planctomycetota bacterium]